MYSESLHASALLRSLDEPAQTWRDVARNGRSDFTQAAKNELRAWQQWDEEDLEANMPRALLPQFRWAIEKLQRHQEPAVTDDDLCIAKKLQDECAAKMRAILANSGPKRNLEERQEVLRRLRDRSKRLGESVRAGREQVVRNESSGLVPETWCRQVEVKLEAERALLEGKLRDWTRQLEAGQIRYDQSEDQVERLKAELDQEQDRHSKMLSALESELREQEDLAQNQLDELLNFEQQADPLVSEYYRLKETTDRVEQQSAEWREKLANVAHNYTEEINRLTEQNDTLRALPSQQMREEPISPHIRVGDLAQKDIFADIGVSRGEYGSRPADESSRAERARNFSPVPPVYRPTPPRPEHAQDLSLIHAEALRTTEMLEREIDALRDGMR